MRLRRFIVLVHDILAASAAWVIAFWLRFNLEVPPEYQDVMFDRLPGVAVIHAVTFLGFGLYRGLWRYASLSDLQRIMVAVAVAGLAVPGLFALARLGSPVPRSVYLIAPMLLVLGMGGSRLAYRAWKEGRLLPIVAKPNAAPVLVLGAGPATASLLRDLHASPEWRVVGVLDDGIGATGGSVSGVNLLGPVDTVAAAAERHGVQHAIIAMPGATHGERRRAVELCTSAGLSVMTVPALTDIMSGKVSISELREVELDDLLGRDPVALDDAGLHHLLEDRTVLVTGAGGSIGAELCRQIARFAPRRIVLFDLSEFALYSIEQEFRDRYPGVPVAAMIGDAKDEIRIEEVFARFSPNVVFHAAAYKHVPLMEEANAYQALKNNVLSTVAVGLAAKRHGADKVVQISTDKAVNPTNVMGASKRLAELACQSLQDQQGTQFVIVRFGNVLGSAGSVVPRFKEQIAKGGPVTVTHPEIERFFMSIPEAAQLVLQAGLMGKGGQIYVLDMGEPVKIVDLAKALIRLSGFAESEIEIRFTGLRPGEKLYEEPLADSETTLATPHPKLRVAQVRPPNGAALLEEICDWISRTRDAQPDQVRERLKGWVPEYEPASIGELHRP